MIEMSKYGFRSRAAFLRATKLPVDLFEQISQDENWKIVKGALLHGECPLSIRDRFASDPVWYKRAVAFFATKAPSNYYLRASKDPDKRIQEMLRKTKAVRLTAYLEG